MLPFFFCISKIHVVFLESSHVIILARIQTWAEERGKEAGNKGGSEKAFIMDHVPPIIYISYVSVTSHLSFPRLVSSRLVSPCHACEVIVMLQRETYIQSPTFDPARKLFRTQINLQLTANRKHAKLSPLPALLENFHAHKKDSSKQAASNTTKAAQQQTTNGERTCSLNQSTSQLPSNHAQCLSEAAPEAVAALALEGVVAVCLLLPRRVEGRRD